MPKATHTLIFPDGSTLTVTLDEPARTPLTVDQEVEYLDSLHACWHEDVGRFGGPRRRFALNRQRRIAHRAARLTSVLRGVRRHAPTRRPGAVVARRRTAGTGKPSGSSGGDGPGQSDEPRGHVARAPRAMSAPNHVPAIAAGTLSCPKEATR